MNKRISTRLSILFLSLCIGISAAYSQQSRDEIAEKYKWDFSGLYASDDEWRAEFEKLKTQLSEIGKFRGTLTNSASNLHKALDFNSELMKSARRISGYVSLKSDTDTRNMKYNGMKQEVQQVLSDYGAKSAYFTPEILSAGWEKIEKFIREEPKLEVYRMSLANRFRMQKHTLSEDEERVMALAGLVAGTPNAVFTTFSNAEMPKPEVVLSTGEKVRLGSAEYSYYRTVPNRDDRKKVFETYWNNYSRFSGTYGEMLYGNIKSRMFNARARNYNSTLEAAMYPNNIPVEVYHSLVENVNKNLPAFHRYLGIRKRMMQVDTLKYLDLYAPVVADLDLKYDYDKATEIILESLKPMGEEYVSTVKKAFNERWIDVYPSEGKRSGAYSSGFDYDGHPYILMNYNDIYSDVSTLTHELGHTMHSYFSNKNQPYPLAGYTTFVAEVASTFNEVLLFNHILSQIDNDDVKLSLLMNWLDGFRGTLFRQTQFAEFELRINQEAEAGRPLTGDVLSNIYGEIVKKYYGHDKNVTYIDDYVKMEWAFIPHFYMNYYVYQYSTSFTASISLAEKVMEGGKPELDSYLAFLSSGGSDFPINLLKKAGVDMTSSEPFDKTIEAMNKVMDEIEVILKKRGL
jgi:oligoendopeptidase F